MEMKTHNDEGRRNVILDRLEPSELAQVNGGIRTTKPMEEGIYIDGVYVQTSAWSVYALLNSGAVGSVVVKGL